MAWHISLSGTTTIIPSEDKLFWVSGWYFPAYAYESLPSEISEQDWHTHIDISELDGTNKRRLYTADGAAYIDDTQLLYDGVNLTFIEHEKVYKYIDTLVIINIETGTIINRVIINRSHYDTIQIVGIYDNKPILIQNIFLK